MYYFNFLQGKISATQTQGTVSVQQLKAGQNVTVNIIPKDQYGNVLLMNSTLLASANFTYNLVNSQQQTILGTSSFVLTNSNNGIQLSHQIKVADSYTINVFMNGVQLSI